MPYTIRDSASAPSTPAAQIDDASDAMVSVYPSGGGGGGGGGVGADGGVCIVVLSCPAVREHQAAVLGDMLKECVRVHGGSIVLDVANVRTFTTAWLNELLATTRRCRSMGGDLVIVGFESGSMVMLRQTGLVRQFTFADSRESAAATFAPGQRKAA